MFVFYQFLSFHFLDNYTKVFRFQVSFFCSNVEGYLLKTFFFEKNITHLPFFFTNFFKDLKI